MFLGEHARCEDASPSDERVELLLRCNVSLNLVPRSAVLPDHYEANGVSEGVAPRHGGGSFLYKIPDVHNSRKITSEKNFYSIGLNTVLFSFRKKI